MLKDLADHIELPLQLGGVLYAGPHTDEHLSDVGADRLGVLTDLGVVQRHIAPAQHLQPFSLDGLADQAAAVGLDLRRHEHHANAILAAGRQVDP